MTTLLDLPNREARALLATGAPVFLPVNPVEYHGPHLSLHNDAIVSHGLIGEMYARLAEQHPDWPLALMPDLEMGVDTVNGPGSRPVSMPEVRAAVLRACRALLSMGARAVVLMTFHGAPLHNLCLDAGARFLSRHGVTALCPFGEVLRGLAAGEGGRMLEAYAPVADEADRRRLMEAAGDDLHAGFLETSLTLHYRPETVSADLANLPPCPPITPSRAFLAAARLADLAGKKETADGLRFAASAFGWHQLKPFPGYTGSPHLANAATGAALATRISTLGAELIQAVLAGEAEPPPPFMAWTGPATLGGRLTAWASKEEEGVTHCRTEPGA